MHPMIVATASIIIYNFISHAFLIMRACVLFVLRTLHKCDDIHTSPTPPRTLHRSEFTLPFASTSQKKFGEIIR